ncbi:hypothetical protein BN946_scf184858.g16 [Trametes cinnabarina]|uniref:Mediator of RNA polymerase II transcription subunit 17 n=1 Tax=Pycnoporus cinnabarinus TaxID=5643 RepID=A0A060SN05_PYCCI|nr:hypothetical protein BN946_scf184858.g16 [Trametes cinnabarina]
MEEEPPWKKLKLSLERPYKDDSGQPLPELLDITPDGQQIYRPREDPTAVVGTKLRRIFLERGTDFFEAQNGSRVFPPPQTRDASTQAEDATDGEKRAESTHAMTPEELYKLRGKDRSLRAAADLFKSAAEKMEDSRLAGERYWLDALKIRRENWGLIPAPLPLGSATGKGADKTSKDFLISFGLEEAPPAFRRRAIGRIAAMDSANTEHPLEFPLRQRTRLRASLTRTRSDGSKETRHSRLTHLNDGSLDGALRAAQAEVVEQEIFSVLIKEASSLPTASAEVSERLIVLDAAQNTELRFELVDSDCMALQQSEDADPLCDLIFMSSHILLLRAHAALKTRRLQKTSISRTVVAAPAAQPPSLLQPIIDMLQYREFWERVYLPGYTTIRWRTAAKLSWLPYKARRRAWWEAKSSSK